MPLNVNNIFLVKISFIVLNFNSFITILTPQPPSPEHPKWCCWTCRNFEVVLCAHLLHRIERALDISIFWQNENCCRCELANRMDLTCLFTWCAWLEIVQQKRFVLHKLWVFLTKALCILRPQRDQTLRRPRNDVKDVKIMTVLGTPHKERQNIFADVGTEQRIKWTEIQTESDKHWGRGGSRRKVL